MDTRDFVQTCKATKTGQDRRDKVKNCYAYAEVAPSRAWPVLGVIAFKAGNTCEHPYTLYSHLKSMQQ